MSLTEKILVKIDVVSDTAISGLKDLKTHVSEADGFMGKLKASGAGLKSLGGDLMSSMGPMGVAGAAGAAAGAVLKLEDNVSKAGIEVGKMADATGLSADQASRWREVADQMGIGAESLTGLFEKATKSIGASKDPMKDFGIEVVKAKDGTTDMNGTMLKAIEHLQNIKDPTERAAEGAKIFGKKWADAAVLINTDMGDLRTSLSQVSGAEIFTASQVKDARKFHESMKELGDSLKAFTTTILKDAMPIVSRFMNLVSLPFKVFGGHDGKDMAQPIEDFAKATKEATGNVWSSFDNLVTNVWNSRSSMDKALDGNGPTSWSKVFIQSFDDVAAQAPEKANQILAMLEGLDKAAGAGNADAQGLLDKWGLNTEKIATMADHLHGLAKEAFDARDGSSMLGEAARNGMAPGLDLADTYAQNLNRDLTILSDQLAALSGNIDVDKMRLNLETAFDGIKAKGIEAWDAAKNHAKDAEQKGRDYQIAIDDAKQSFIQLADKAKLPPEQIQTISILLDQGKFDEAEKLVKGLSLPSTHYVDVVGVWQGVAGLPGAMKGGIKPDGPVTRSEAIWDLSHYGPIDPKSVQAVSQSTVGMAGQRAAGGPVGQDQPYLVGEKGPEMFVPHTDGTIIPHGQTGGTVNHIYITMPDMSPESMNALLQRYAARNK